MSKPRDVQISVEIARFLLGEGPLEGVWFGEPHPSGLAFWWRRNLKSHIVNAQAAERYPEAHHPCDRCGEEVYFAEGDERGRCFNDGCGGWANRPA